MMKTQMGRAPWYGLGIGVLASLLTLILSVVSEYLGSLGWLFTCFAVGFLSYKKMPGRKAGLVLGTVAGFSSSILLLIGAMLTGSYILGMVGLIWSCAICSIVGFLAGYVAERGRIPLRVQDDNPRNEGVRRTTPAAWPGQSLSEAERHVLAYLEEHQNRISLSGASTSLQVSAEEIGRILDTLADKGLIKKKAT